MTQRSRRFLGQLAVSLVFLLLLLGHVGGLYNFYFVEKLDASLYDLKLRLFREQGVDDRVVIVDIDEKSLREIGRWPWPRKVTAQLTENLFEQYGVAAVGFDIVFAEPDQSSGLPVLKDLARGPLAGEAGFARLLDRVAPGLDYDARLANALGKGPTVLGYYFGFGPAAGRVGALPPPLSPCNQLAAQGVRPLVASGHGANLPGLQVKASDAGFFNVQPDFDGVIRRQPLLIEYQGQCYGALALSLVRAGLGLGAPQVLAAGEARALSTSPASLALDGIQAPLDENAMVLVPYRTERAYRYIPATDVIHGRAPAAELEGRLVLIGATAPGIMDLRVTPTAKAFPGVEIHANVVSGLLDGSIKWEPAQARRWNLIAVAVFGLVLALWLPFATPVWAAAVAAGLLALTIGLDFYAWSVQHLSLAPASLLLALAGLFILNMSYGFFVEARAKHLITRLFGQYVPPELVEEMAKDPARYSLRGQSREMTVLFSDIRDFTSISEGLEAAELADMLNVYLSAMTRVVQEHRGTIDKYIGDAIMAFWGAPLSNERHARDGVLTALAMQRELAALNPQLEARGWPPVKIGVGVNTGRMSVGNMGSEFRMAYTVMADAVNLASRLEGLTKQYGVGVLCGEATRAACPDIAFRLIDRVRVKGKAQPVAIYQALGLKAELDAAVLRLAERFESALADYQARRWDAAESTLRALNTETPEPLYGVYLERIEHFRREPPPADWDGVFTYTTK
ncbi:adenylate cyclase [Sulfuritortus calidifontis]|uniref:Adenylate cyclase n=1 Tax=Sulfuritortus calidifontis TaxID=1914471 RepID=A0A4V2UQW7_9PROT|nr:adenylate/guanylate cyclase domain-containing protein [Sulfuritortus calidifontis]TCS73027.1 adenylate cyclase [Sulfuritortus calidifontis]